MDTSKVARVEVINHHVGEDSKDFGRVYVYWPERCKTHRTKDCPHCKPNVELHLQDDDRTLKIFIR